MGLEIVSDPVFLPYVEQSLSVENIREQIPSPHKCVYVPCYAKIKVSTKMSLFVTNLDLCSS